VRSTAVASHRFLCSSTCSAACYPATRLNPSQEAPDTPELSARPTLSVSGAFWETKTTDEVRGVAWPALQRLYGRAGASMVTERRHVLRCSSMIKILYGDVST